MKAESIIFDLDGTLWDSSESVAASWDETVGAYGHAVMKGRTITGEVIRGVMGMTMDAIAAKLFPELSPEAQTELMDKCSENEIIYLSEHGGTLFEGTKETLERLSENHRLFIVSNCQQGYIEAFFESRGMEKYFTDYLCWGDTGRPKGETIRILMERREIHSACYVGDTEGDLEESIAAGIPFIHASYGFGKLSRPEKAAAAVSSIRELAKIIE